MEQMNLNVDARENTGKGFNRRLRKLDKVPATLYGMGTPSNLAVETGVIVKNLLSETGKNAIYNLKGAGLDGKHALVKDYQVDPLSRKLLHVDLMQIDVSKKVAVTVQVHFVGKCAGVSDGGIMNTINRSVEIRCLPTAIPTHLDADITNLKIGDSLHLDDLQLPEGVEKVGALNPTLVAIVPPAKEEELKAQTDAPAAPEVIGAKKEEGAEGAAAAAPAAAKEEKKK